MYTISSVLDAFQNCPIALVCSVLYKRAGKISNHKFRGQGKSLIANKKTKELVQLNRREWVVNRQLHRFLQPIGWVELFPSPRQALGPIYLQSLDSPFEIWEDFLEVESAKVQEYTNLGPEIYLHRPLHLNTRRISWVQIHLGSRMYGCPTLTVRHPFPRGGMRELMGSGRASTSWGNYEPLKAL